VSPRGPMVQVEQRGAGKAALDLKALGVRARDVRRVRREVRDVFEASEQRRFAGGAGWPPLADSTRERKAAQGLDPRILRATNALYRSLTSSAAGSLDEAERDAFQFGSTLYYAGFHDTGKGVPKRDLIELRPSERNEVTRILGDYIIKGGRR
jgi:phage gpG-like protein